MSKIKSHISEEFIKDFKIKYPNLIPVFVQTKAENIKLRKSKFLTSEKFTGSQFLQKLNENLIKTIPSSCFLYVCQNDKFKSLPKNQTMKTVYENFKNQVGYLHIVIYSQNPF